MKRASANEERGRKEASGMGRMRSGVSPSAVFASPCRLSLCLFLFCALFFGVSTAPLPAGAQDPAPESGEPSRRVELQGQIEELGRELATTAAGLGEAGADAPELVALRRLRDALQRNEEVLGVAVQLEAAAKEARRRSEREPASLFTSEPPYPVPLLDGVFTAWEAQTRQLEKLSQLVEDREAAEKASREDLDDAERTRRRVKDELERSGEESERAELGRELRLREIESRIARAELELAEIESGNAKLEYAIQVESEVQAAAALAWVRTNLAPDTGHLDDVLADLEKRSFDLDRALESTRLDLAAAASRLDAAQERADQAAEREAELNLAELTARRLQFTAAQRRVALLGERIQRLALARDGWRRRYEALTGDVTPEDTRSWLAEGREHLDDLARERRIKQARLGELEGDLAELRGQIAGAVSGESTTGGLTLGWLGAQENELVALIGLYRDDVANLDEVLRLERRLIAELEQREHGLAVGERVGRWGEDLQEVWAYELTASEDRPITVGKVVTALLIFSLGWLLARRLGRLLGGRVLRRFGLDVGVASAFESLFFYGAVVVVFLVALRTVNIPLTAFAVAGGAVALGLGFGSQTVVSNFISGLILLAERPIKLGDHIEVDGVYGQVEQIGLRSTRIRTGDNFHIIVPNASFLERSVVNWTHSNTRVRVKVSLGVAYGSPTRRVEEVLLEVVRTQRAVLASPEPMVLFQDFGESCLLFEARFWITVRSLLDRPLIESDVRYAIDERFRKEGISIAFPQRDVHLNAAGPIEVRLRSSDSDPGELPRPPREA